MNIKSIAPLLLLLLLGGLAYYFVTAKDTKRSDNMDLSRDWVMHVENADDIHRIFIADRSGNKADVVRDKERWIYNGKYTANPFVVSNVLNALTDVRLKNRPAAAAIPRMIEVLSTKSTKVEVYGKNNELLKAFYIGGVTPDERGTFMILEGSENPYVMHIPLDEVSLKQRFFTGDLKWRDKTVLGVEASEIASLSVEYPKKKNRSFKLKRNKGKWDVEPFYPTTKKIDKPVNQELTESYLKGYKSVRAEGFQRRNEEIDKSMSKKEFCIINILLTDGSTQRINFFPILKFEDEASEKPLPVERYIAINEKQDRYMVQHLVFKDIFWAYDFFF